MISTLPILIFLTMVELAAIIMGPGKTNVYLAHIQQVSVLCKQKSRCLE